MPEYTYRCNSCSKFIDIWQSITDEKLKSCDSCNGELIRLITKVGISFKGSGFYVNDNKENK